VERDKLREGGKAEVSCPHCGKEYTVAAGTNPALWECPSCGKKYIDSE
jgi:uncharacterized Zn-finger protein